MTCKAYETHLIEKCEGTLSPTLTRELDEHLVGCLPCQEGLASLEEVFGGLKRLKEKTPRAPLFYFSTLLYRTRTRIRKETGEEVSLWDKIKSLLRLPQLVPVALAALILILTFSNQTEEQYTIKLAMEINAHHIYDPALLDTYETLEFLNSEQIETLLKTLEQKLEVTS